MLESVRGLALRRVGIGAYRIPVLACLTNALIGRFVSIGTVRFRIGLLEPVAPPSLPMNARGFVVGYIVWESAHYVYHRLAHRVRVLWCLHATHHAPEHMDLSVSHAHFFLEAPYADLVRTSICVMLGVPPPMLLVIVLVDGTWGACIHVGDTLLRKPDLPPEYGIARKTGPTGFLDAYAGEIVALARDVRTAPGARNTLLYPFMPPGWRHAGDRGTAGAPRAALPVGR